MMLSLVAPDIYYLLSRGLSMHGVNGAASEHWGMVLEFQFVFEGNYLLNKFSSWS